MPQCRSHKASKTVLETRRTVPRELCNAPQERLLFSGCRTCKMPISRYGSREIDRRDLLCKGPEFSLYVRSTLLSRCICFLHECPSNGAPWTTDHGERCCATWNQRKLMMFHYRTLLLRQGRKGYLVLRYGFRSDRTA